MWETTTKTNERIDALEQVLNDHMKDCTRQHGEHVEHRQRLYDKLDEAIDYLKEISATLKENKPIIERAHNNFVTVDTIKVWALWIGAIGAAAASIAAMFKFFG